MNQDTEIQRLRAVLREIFTCTQPTAVGSVCEHGDEQLLEGRGSEIERDHYASHLKAIHTLASNALYRPYPVGEACGLRLAGRSIADKGCNG